MLSVIIPAHNAEKYLHECLESVFVSLPRHMDSEVIVVDDGSEDRTASIAASLDCIVLQQEQRGAATARNRGLAAAQGTYVFFLDADDILCDGALNTLLAALQQDAEMLAVFAQAMDFISPELPLAVQNRFIPRVGPYAGILSGCALFRRVVFEHTGPFDETLMTGESVAWLLNMQEKRVKTLSLDYVSLRRRLHPASTGARYCERERKDYLAILRRRVAKKN